MGYCYRNNVIIAITLINLSLSLYYFQVLAVKSADKVRKNLAINSARSQPLNENIINKYGHLKILKQPAAQQTASNYGRMAISQIIQTKPTIFNNVTSNMCQTLQTQSILMLV